MAQLAVAAAGAAVGSLFGAPQVGWLVGSFIGSQLFAEKQQTEGGASPLLDRAPLPAALLGVWRTGPSRDSAGVRCLCRSTSRAFGGLALDPFTGGALALLALCPSRRT